MKTIRLFITKFTGKKNKRSYLSWYIKYLFFHLHPLRGRRNLFYSKPRRIENRSSNRFNLKVLFEAIHSHISTKTTLFVSTIRTIWIKSKIAIDPNSTCSYWSWNCVGNVQVVSHNTSSQTILCCICSFDYFFDSPVCVNYEDYRLLFLNKNWKKKKRGKIM